jgi:hypothetical protein
MKKLTVLLLLLALYVTPTFSQKPKPAAPAPRPATPKTPPPYVLKKDYEAQMEELKGKINAVSNAAASARNGMSSMENRLGQVTELDSQMRQVQEILNSASFQIAMNADSLKETRFSVDELAKKTDASISTIEEQQQSTSMLLYILFGVALAATIGVLVFLLSALQKRMATIESMLHKNEEVLKKSLSNNLEKAQQQLTTELQTSESRMLTDISILKRELTVQLNAEKERSAFAINELAAKLEALNGNSDETTEGNIEPDTFI